MKHKVILFAILIIFSVPVYERGEAYFEKPSLQEEIINVTVNEVWEMLNNESDGIQFVVDVRTFKEYFNERIATPHLYDKPILYPLQIIQNPLFSKIFVLIFKNKEVILYCRSANRSWIAGNILISSGFEGKLYNMVGGIIEWKANGLPTVSGFGFRK